MSKRKFYVQPVALDDTARARVTALYREEHHAVKAYLHRKGIEGAAAEDLCQDVFIYLLYAGPVGPGWLFGTARFVARAVLGGMGDAVTVRKEARRGERRWVIDIVYRERDGARALELELAQRGLSQSTRNQLR